MLVKIDQNHLSFKVKDLLFHIPLSLKVFSKLVQLNKNFYIPANATVQELIDKVSVVLDNQSAPSVYFKGKQIQINNQLMKNLGIIPFSKLLVITSFGIGSNIVKGDDMKLLQNWSGNSALKLQLIYRGTEDGWQKPDYWDRVENVSNCFVFLKSTNQNRFGGFRSKPFLQNSGYRHDPNAFLFSFTHAKKVPQRDNSSKQYAIYDNPGYMPTWGGGHDLKIAFNCSTGKSSYSNLGYTYNCDPLTYNSEGAKAFFAGAYQFQIEELEIYEMQ